MSQDGLGERLGVSRQTISKWESAQSYPDFQRLVLLSDYFGLSLDELVKGIDVDDVRDKNSSDKQIAKIYDDVEKAKLSISTVISGLAIVGVVGVVLFLIIGILG